MKLRLSPRALGDLHEICDYIRERNPAAATRVRDAIRASLQIIATYPHAGRTRRGCIRRFALPRYPYLIFYNVEEEAGEVRILTIRHAAQTEER